MNGTAVLALTLLLVLGSMGWGLFFQMQLMRFHRITSSALASNYLQIPIGISLFLLVFGWLVALGICTMWSVLLWHFIGVAKLAANYILSKGLKRRVLNWSASLINTIILLVCSLTSLGVVASRTFQKMDDLPAYAYLAQKLVATGGLIDPFSSRRILSYGGATLYQAVFVKFTGLQSIFAFDNLFMPVVLVITLLLYGRSHKLSPWLLGLLSLCLVAGTSSLILFNLSPRFAITFFTLVVLLASFDLARSNSRVGSDYVLVMGLLIASLSTMRVENAVAPAIVVLLTIVWDRRSAFRHALLLVGIGILSVSGWAFALYRSSGTFLFPIMRGTANMSFYFDPVHWGISQYLTLLWDGIALENQFAILAALLVSALCIYLSVNRDVHLVRALLFVASGVIVQLVIMVLGIKGFDGNTFARYFGPTILASGMFAALLLLVKNKVTLQNTDNRLSVFNNVLSLPSKNVFNMGALFLVLLCCFGYSTGYSTVAVKRSAMPLFTTEFKTSFTNASSFLHEGVLTLVDSKSSTISADAHRSEIAKINAAIPEQSTVLSAIEAPGFLNMKKFIVLTLDWPGAGSINSSVPLDGTVAEFIKYLHQVHINYLLIENNYNGTLYDSTAANKLITGEYNYSTIGRSVLNWNAMTKAILADKALARVRIGNYRVISIK